MELPKIYTLPKFAYTCLLSFRTIINLDYFTSFFKGIIIDSEPCVFLILIITVKFRCYDPRLYRPLTYNVHLACK